MSLIYEWGFFVKEMDPLKEWLAEHESELARNAPAGMEYLGTYLPVWAPEQRCDMYQVWRWRGARDFDLRSAAGGDRSDFARLAGEFLGFVDDTRSADETFRLHRSAAGSADVAAGT